MNIILTTDRLLFSSPTIHGSSDQEDFLLNLLGGNKFTFANVFEIVLSTYSRIQSPPFN